jgi:hypothetical protein
VVAKRMNRIHRALADNAVYDGKLYAILQPGTEEVAAIDLHSKIERWEERANGLLP